MIYAPKKIEIRNWKVKARNWKIAVGN